MSGVDVLAVMDRYAAEFRPNAGCDGVDLEEARAAVAELIEAVGDFFGDDDHRCNQPCLACRIRDALEATGSQP